MKNTPLTRVWFQPFTGPDEYQEVLSNLHISSQFDMRFRGLYEHYGKEFIAFKRENPHDPSRNEFLRIFSSYMTDYLEDDCPASWKDCRPSFWKEFILYYFPCRMTVSPEEKEVDRLLPQFIKFVSWLDKRVGTSWSNIVKKYAQEAYFELKNCESLLNSLFLIQYPRIFNNDWNATKDIDKLEELLNSLHESFIGYFQIKEISENVVIATNIKDQRVYHIKGLPNNTMVPGFLLHGCIGKRSNEKYWIWCYTSGVYPKRAKKFILRMIN